jgi:hypothetical protein
MGRKSCSYYGAGILFAFPKKKESDWEVCLFKRAVRPYKGYWSVLGGRSNPGETFRETAKREACEEGFKGKDFANALKCYLPESFNMEEISEEICFNNLFFKWRNYLVKLKNQPPIEIFTLNYENYLAQWFPVNTLPVDVFPGIPKTIKKFNLV